VTADLRRALAALAALAGGAAALHQLLVGWHWFALVVATGILVGGLGVAGRAVRAPAAMIVAIQVVAVTLLVTAAFASSAAIGGLLPGPAALASLADTVQTGTDAVNHYAPPAPALAGIELLLVLGSGAAAIVLDVLIDRGLPALTGLVVLALQSATALCLTAGISTVSFLLGGAGWLAVLLTCAPRPTDREPDPEPPAATPHLTGLVGRRTAVASLGLAALAPVVIPGLSSGRLTRLFSDVGAGDGTGPAAAGGDLLVVRNPLVELRRNLVQPQDVEVLRYGTADTDGQYLRLATLDLFDGQTWTARPDQPRQRVDLGIAAAEGLTAAVPRVAETIGFTVAAGLSSRYLPVPYPATKVQARGGWWYNPAGLDVLSYGWLAAGGFTYSVQSLDLSFDPAALRAATPAPPVVRDRDLALPAMPAVVETTMRRVVAGAKTDFDRAVALQEWFRGEFTYDTSIVDASSTGAIVRFLASRRGYCEQFAATMAIMARQLDIPARVVVGFLPGSRPDVQWIVSAHEAHAWPELYFGGSGWVRFEPTPATQSGSEPDWTLDSSLVGAGDAQPSTPASAVPHLLHPPIPAAAAAPATSTGSGATGHSRLPGVLAGIVGVAAVGLGTPAVVAGAARERRWRTAHHAAAVPSATGSPEAESVAAAVQVDLADAAWEYIGGWAPATTPRQIGERLQRALRTEPEAAAAAGRLVSLVEQDRFAPVGTAVPDLDAARIRRDSDLVRHTLALRRPWRVRVRAAVVPVGLRRRLASARPADHSTEQAAERAAELTRTAPEGTGPTRTR
jgi:transglutaminase-like putative cysteine protease